MNKCRLCRSVLTAFAGLALSAVWGSAAQAQTAYTLTDVAPYTGSLSDKSVGLNAAGQVTGSTKDTRGNGRAFVWTPSAPDPTRGSLALLTLPKGDMSSGASSINAAAQVAGVAYNTNTGKGYYAQVWSGTAPAGTIVPPSPLTESRSWGINAAGQVTGFLADSNLNNRTAFLWSNGTLVNLGAQLGAAWSGARGVNRYGWVAVGSSAGAFLWQPSQPNGTAGTFRALPLFEADGVNDSGQVLGVVDIGYTVLGVYSTASGTLQQMPTPSSFTSAWAGTINNAGQAVGYVQGSTQPGVNPHAFRWDSADTSAGSNGRLVDLAAVSVYTPGGAAATGWQLESADDINDAGQIVGHGLNPTGQMHIFLLTPR